MAEFFQLSTIERLEALDVVANITQLSQVDFNLYQMTARWLNWLPTINTWSVTAYFSMTLSHSKH